MPRNQTLVSVLMPCYNHEAYVKAAVQSVIEQTFEDIELIVVNDGSTDNTGRILDEMDRHCQERFRRYVRIDQQNRGTVAALQRAFDAANGAFVSVLGSDDRFLRNKIEDLVHQMQQAGPDVGVVVGDARFVGDQGQLIEVLQGAEYCSHFIPFYLSGRRLDAEERGSYMSLLESNYIPAMSTLIRSRNLQEVGGFDSGFLLEDWPLWLKLARTSSIRFIDQVVAEYRLHGANTSQRVSFSEEVGQALVQEWPFCKTQTELRRAWLSRTARTLLPLLNGGKVSSARHLLATAPIAELAPYLLRGASKALRTRAKRLATRLITRQTPSPRIREIEASARDQEY